MAIERHSAAYQTSANYAYVLSVLQEHPYLAVDLGLVYIKRTYNEDGTPVKSARDRIGPYKRNLGQQKVRQYAEQLRSSGDPVKLMILKARDQGVSTEVLTGMVARLATTPGLKGLSVAHRDTAAKNILSMGKAMAKNLPHPFKLRSGAKMKDSAECYTFNMPQWGISGSELTCIEATKARIEHIRSDRIDMFHGSESSRWADSCVIMEALNGTLIDSRHSEEIEETTGNGEDPYFHPMFMQAWLAQGKKNGWERGALESSYPKHAIMLPFFLDYRKEAPLHSDVTESYFRSRLDDYEKEVLHTIKTYWEGEGWDEDAAVSRALRNLNWRRAKLMNEYLDGPNFVPKVRIPQQGLTSIESFMREEPVYVEEAFLVRKGKPVFSENELTYIRSCVRPPSFQGEIKNPSTLVPGGYGGIVKDHLWMWKTNKEIVGDIIMGFDFAQGHHKSEANSSRNAFHWVSIFERTDDGILEQIGEYVSQLPQTQLFKVLWDIVRYYSEDYKKGKCPYLAPECQYGGTTFINFLLGEYYPRFRIYGRKESGKRTSKLGFWTNPRSKEEAVKCLGSRIAEHRMIIRSSRLASQFGNFMHGEKEGEYFGLNKQSSSMAQKDDGVLTTMFVAKYDEDYFEDPEEEENQEKVVTKIIKKFDPNLCHGGDLSHFFDWIEHQRKQVSRR